MNRQAYMASSCRAQADQQTRQVCCATWQSVGCGLLASRCRFDIQHGVREGSVVQHAHLHACLPSKVQHGSEHACLQCQLLP